MHNLDLLPEDWDAARRVVNNRQEKFPESEQFLRFLAEQHAKLGEGTFGLVFGLREPRHPLERLGLLTIRQQITQTEYESRVRLIESQPLSYEIADASYMEQELRLQWLSRFVNAVVSRANCGTLGRELRVSAPVRDRYFRELGRRMSLSESLLLSTIRFAEQTRVIRSMGRVAVDSLIDACAFSVVNQVISEVQQRWTEACATANVQNTDEDFDYSVSAENVFVPYLNRMPSLDEIQSLLREEAAAVRVASAPQSAPPIRSSPETTVVNHVHVNPTPIVIHQNIVPTNNAKSKRTPRVAETRPSPPSNHIAFQNWAFGLEDGKRWILFHRDKGRWEQRRIISIPAGHQTRLLAAFAERDGALETKEAFKIQQPHYPSYDTKKVFELIKNSMSDLRSTIRESIATTAKCQIESGLNPIPLKNRVWRAQIQVGYAIQDDQGKLTFQLRSGM